jgi:hypothetical protein
MKTTTGLVGLKVVPNAHSELFKLQQRIIHNLQRLPPSTFVTSTTNLYVKRQELLNGDIEKELGFQMEELIEQAKSELELIATINL